jgi:hypothetical protein
LTSYLQSKQKIKICVATVLAVAGSLLTPMTELAQSATAFQLSERFRQRIPATTQIAKAVPGPNGTVYAALEEPTSAGSVLKIFGSASEATYVLPDGLSGFEDLVVNGKGVATLLTRSSNQRFLISVDSGGIETFRQPIAGSTQVLSSLLLLSDNSIVLAASQGVERRDGGDGHLIWNVLPDRMGDNVRFSAWGQDNIVVHSLATGVVNWISPGGAVTGTYHPDIPRYTSTTALPDGSIGVLHVSLCSEGFSKPRMLRVTQSGVLWNTTAANATTTCSTQIYLEGLSNGLILTNLDPSTGDYGFLRAVGADGMTLWTNESLPPSVGPLNFGGGLISTDGHIIAATTREPVECPSLEGATGCQSISLAVVTVEGKTAGTINISKPATDSTGRTIDWLDIAAPQLGFGSAVVVLGAHQSQFFSGGYNQIVLFGGVDTKKTQTPSVSGFGVCDPNTARPGLPRLVRADTNCDGAVRVAILGDSYISGEGAATGIGTNEFPMEYEPGTDHYQNVFKINLCHRSKATWAYRAAKALTSDDQILFAACSGAVTADVLSQGQYPRGKKNIGLLPQIQELQRAQAVAPFDIIFLSIGGNNADFEGVVIDCLTSRCLWGLGWQARRSSATNIESVLAQTYEELTAAAPSAEFWVADYPDPTNTKTCGSAGLANPLDNLPAWLRAPLISLANQEFELDVPEQTWIRDKFIIAINDSVRAAVAKAGLNLFEVQNEFLNHKICDADNYANGITAGNDTLPNVGPIGSESFHPNAAGHKHLFEVMKQRIFTSSTFGTKASSRKPMQPAVIPATRGWNFEVSGTPTADSLLRPGESLQISGAGGRPGERLNLFFNSIPAFAGSVQASNDGTFTATVTIPSWLPPGFHRLTIVNAGTQEILQTTLLAVDAISDGCRPLPNDSDVDGDIRPDRCDPDSSDGPLADIDSDSITNATDNCAVLSNQNQEDANGNGIGDVCDPSFGKSPFDKAREADWSPPPLTTTSTTSPTATTTTTAAVSQTTLVTSSQTILSQLTTTTSTTISPMPQVFSKGTTELIPTAAIPETEQQVLPVPSTAPSTPSAKQGEQTTQTTPPPTWLKPAVVPAPAQQPVPLRYQRPCQLRIDLAKPRSIVSVRLNKRKARTTKAVAGPDGLACFNSLPPGTYLVTFTSKSGNSRKRSVRVGRSKV